MHVLLHTWLLFKHNFIVTVRNPVYVILALFQPICQLILFAPLLESIESAPNFPPGGAYTVFTPGLLVMMGITGALFVGFGFISDMRAGVMERLQVTPVSRFALVLSRSLCDMTMFLAQAAALMVVAWQFGMRPHPLGVLVAILLFMMVSLFTSSVSYATAFATADENTFSSILNFLIMPILMLSGITLPLALAPLWIRNAARFNPFSYAVDASRALFIGNLTDTSVMLGFVVMALMTVVGMYWAFSSFRRGMA